MSWEVGLIHGLIFYKVVKEWLRKEVIKCWLSNMSGIDECMYEWVSLTLQSRVVRTGQTNISNQLNQRSRLPLD